MYDSVTAAPMMRMLCALWNLSTYVYIDMSEEGAIARKPDYTHFHR